MEEYPPLYKHGLQQDDFGTMWRVNRMGICGIPVAWPMQTSPVTTSIDDLPIFLRDRLQAAVQRSSVRV